MMTYFAKGGIEEAYNVRDDPWQQTNLVPDPPGWVDDWRLRLIDWERVHGFPSSFQGHTFRAYPAQPPPREEDYLTVRLNDVA